MGASHPFAKNAKWWGNLRVNQQRSVKILQLLLKVIKAGDGVDLAANFVLGGGSFGVSERGFAAAAIGIELIGVVAVVDAVGNVKRTATIT